MEELMKKKDEETKKAEEEEWTMQCYAAVFVLVASFQIWNRPVKWHDIPSTETVSSRLKMSRDRRNQRKESVVRV
jgi:hypothetical protein